VNLSSSRFWIRRAIPSLLVAAAAVLAIAYARGAFRHATTAASVPFEAVERRDITVTVEATGTVEPINLIEVKSKASGQIIRMPVDIGSVVRPGQLLVQIDSSDVRNQYDQAFATLQAAKAKVEVSTAQKKRSDSLYEQQITTADEHEAAVLDLANAQSALVGARTNLDIARQRLADATVRAPIAGTILDKPVSVGTVISSATSSVSGGTTLLQMADLRMIRVRALVSETDIGNVKPDQAATVQVDAFPNRPFHGVVEKIEPQSVVQQSVTMFPVLISISNEEGLLLPGMNGEVTVLVQERDGVPSVSLDAIRTMREIPTVAAALGMDADSVRAQVQAQMMARAGGARGNGGAGGTNGTGGPGGAGGAGLAGVQVAQAGQADPGGRTGARADSTRGRGEGTGRWGRSGGGWNRQRAGAGGGTGGGFAGGSGSARGVSGGAAAGGNGGTGRGGSGRQSQIVFVQTPQGLEPRVVRIGVSNFDYAEILDGLVEGDQVALLSVAELQAKRNQNMSNIRQRMGGAVPGVGGGGGTGRSTTGRRGGS
jgi:HlyD family secretion protein